MNFILSTNSMYYVLIIVIFGKAVKPLITKHRKIILPALLMVFGILLSVGVNYFNGNTLIGNAILEGIVSSIVAQFSFDKVKDIMSKGVGE